jgi:dynein heavy chain 2, cytosolic
MDIMNNWIQICDSLTRLFWTNCESHPWSGKPYIPSMMTKFKTRVEEINDIKQVHKQISLLSTEDETIDMKSRDYFYSFRDINIFDTTPIGEKYWNTAKAKFEQSLSNIDEKIAMNIKFSIQSSLNNPRQVIYIFSKYENILKRQKIKDALKIECDHLHQSVLTFVKQLNQALIDSKKNPHDDDEDVSPIVSEIKWLKIIEYQVQEINQICLNVLQDRSDFEELKKNLAEFQSEMETSIRQNFDHWCEQSMSSVVSGELVLKDNEPVVKFEKKDRQLMTVTYNPKLLVFCQDIRYLKNFGFKNIPNDLVKYGTIGRKYIKYARNLQQISNFHNTIGDRIIPCQRPIMLKNAMELSNLVKSQSVSWNDEESVKKYIMVLQEAINTLSRDNNLLSGYHENMKKSVSC